MTGRREGHKVPLSVFLEDGNGPAVCLLQRKSHMRSRLCFVCNVGITIVATLLLWVVPVGRAAPHEVGLTQSLRTFSPVRAIRDFRAVTPLKLVWANGRLLPQDVSELLESTSLFGSPVAHSFDHPHL
jgi:hypothetical protein